MHTMIITYIITCACLGKVGNGNMSVDDSAFDGFLKQVEHMHTQGKASFKAEFDVSQLGLELLLRAHHQLSVHFILLHTHTHTHTHICTNICACSYSPLT